MPSNSGVIASDLLVLCLDAQGRVPIYPRLLCPTNAGSLTMDKDHAKSDLKVARVLEAWMAAVLGLD